MSLDDAIADFTTTYQDPHRLTVLTGAIDHITPGGAADGTTAAFVTVLGSTLPAPYCASYTPVAADKVAVLLIDGSPLILGKITGPPAI